MSDRSTFHPLRDRLVGTWALGGYSMTRHDGVVSHPLGAKPVGQILYGPDGYMSALLGEDHGFAGGGEVTIAYAGTYEVDEDEGTVTHVPTVSLISAWRDTTLVRAITFSESGSLLLTTREPVDTPSGPSRAVIEWVRLPR